MATPQIAQTTLSPGFTPVMGDLRGVVDRAVSGARACGRDYLGQCHVAAQAVMAVRPDLSPREAFDAVTRLRDH